MTDLVTEYTNEIIEAIRALAAAMIGAESAAIVRDEIGRPSSPDRPLTSQPPPQGGCTVRLAAVGEAAGRPEGSRYGAQATVRGPIIGIRTPELEQNLETILT